MNKEQQYHRDSGASRIDLFIHQEGSAHEHILAQVLDALAKMEARIMAKFDTVVSLLNAINTATDAEAAAVQVLIDQINATATDGLNGPQTEEVLNRLDGFRQRLEAMAASAQNPIPTPPPVNPAPLPA